ncbi:MAG TPA: hypothetical protein VF131_26870 [Blastocatellia bacterium]|nr:hypothetical protein [Blastocatellia bacterium]
MEWTGTLSITDLIARIRNTTPPLSAASVRLALRQDINPILAARSALVAGGFVDDETVTITGETGVIGTVPVLFMSTIHHGAAARTAIKVSARKAAKKGRKASAKSAAKKSTAKKAGTKRAATKAAKSGAKKSAKRTARKGGKKQK